LKERGEYENTLIIVTSDNGMPFPRAKATLYDAGTRVPLIIRMQGRITPQETGAFVSLTDIAPTILELSGEKIPEAMSGSSLWPVLRREKVDGHTKVFTERERHANVRKAELGYPARAIRTDDFLYIRNYAPERWPAGDPDLYHSVGPYGDIDASPSKEQIMTQREQSHIEPFFSLIFFKRPSEELYDLRADPYQKNNVAYSGKYRKVLGRLKKQLDQWQEDTGDPRVDANYRGFDHYPYFGPPVQGAPSTYKP
jgi:arylsulfatase A-like enzyme